MTRSSDFQKLRFALPAKEDFYFTLKKRVAEHFETTKRPRHADKRAVAKALILIGFLVILYSILISDKVHGWKFIGVFVLAGLTEILLGFNIYHDVNHGAFFAHSKWNSLCSYGFDLIGLSSFVWKKFHNGAHHTYTNIPGFDGDIERSPFIRMSPQDKLYSIQRYQHLYAPLLLYGLGTLNKVFYTDYKDLWLISKKEPPPKKELFLFFFFKISNLIIFLAIPWMVTTVPAWQIFVGFLAAHFIGGSLMSLIFQLAHIGDELEFPHPESAKTTTWAEHQLRTTVDFATSNRWLNWLLGGLNFQAIHHLFPYICHTHYREVSAIVKKTAGEFGVTYHEHPTLWQAIRSHIAQLRKFGHGKE